MNQGILAPSAPLPRRRRPQTPMPSTSGRTDRTEPNWSPPQRRGAGLAVCRLLGRLFGIDPNRHACWCFRCTLHHPGVYRREHVRHGQSSWVRTTVFGIRLIPDRHAFPLR